MDEHRFSLLLSLIQTLEPAGVGARSLSECLCLQLERKNALTPDLKEFIDNHLTQMAKNQLPAIAKDQSLSMDEVKEFCRIVRELNPRPAANLGRVYHTHYINPDVIVVKFKGHLDVLLNESLYPDIMMNHQYLKMYEEHEEKEVREYLQCTWGTFPLNHFFAKNAIRSAKNTVFRSAAESAELTTSYDIKAAMKEIIASENRKKPFSDRILSEMLTERGFSISRRTVAKYREEENIPGASGRKQY